MVPTACDASSFSCSPGRRLWSPVAAPESELEPELEPELELLTESDPELKPAPAPELDSELAAAKHPRRRPSERTRVLGKPLGVAIVLLGASGESGATGGRWWRGPGANYEILQHRARLRAQATGGTAPAPIPPTNIFFPPGEREHSVRTPAAVRAQLHRAAPGRAEHSSRDQTRPDQTRPPEQSRRERPTSRCSCLPQRVRWCARSPASRPRCSACLQRQQQQQVALVL